MPRCPVRGQPPGRGVVRRRQGRAPASSPPVPRPAAVDYIASGHFGLYERISEGKERRRGVVKLAEKLYPRIANTTQVAVEFNDVYEKMNGKSISGEITGMLSKLGEELAVRIELEDQLISEMLGQA